MDKENVISEKTVRMLRCFYWIFLGMALVVILLGAWMLWFSDTAVQASSVDAETAYIFSGVAVLVTLVLIPLGLKYPFLPFVRKGLTVSRDKRDEAYTIMYVRRLGIQVAPVVICFANLLLSRYESAFYLLVLSAFPLLLVYPGEGRARHEMGYDKEN